MEDIQYQKLIYSKEKVSVHKGIRTSDKLPVCVKILYADSIAEADTLLKEANNNYRFKDSGMGIVTIYDSQIGGYNQNQIYVRVVMEFFKEGDLATWIAKRTTEPWGEAELFDYLTQLVTTFSYLQDKGVAHRDIKPENILVSDDRKNLIVGDLGCAREKKRNSGQTIVGTPMYLSPEIRQEYANFIQGVPQGIEYDSYKSDVYSLGLTFLYMASRRELSDLLGTSGLKEKTIARVQKLEAEYPRFCKVLGWMLSYDQRERPDFTELNRFLSTQPILGTRCFFCDKISENCHSVVEKPLCAACIEELSTMLWKNILK